MIIILLLALAALIFFAHMTFQVAGAVLVCLILLIVWLIKRRKR